MVEVDLDEGIRDALDSLLSNRLSVIAGAGLSMAPPSSLPSAAQLARDAKTKYTATYGAVRPPLPDPIEQQAEYFFARGELESIYLNQLVGFHAFATKPNPGHYAIADLLLIHALRSVVTTNVDTLIEMAGQMLFGQIGAGVDGHAITALPPEVPPLLKLHGCRASDPANTVWSPGQLAVPPVSTRIERSATWLNANLINRDLLVVGYWTDWDYLNAIFARTLNAVTPTRVIVVDIAEGVTFASKAPALFALGERATNGFKHVRESGAAFLDLLRKEFSRTFIRRLLSLGVPAFTEKTGAAPNPVWVEPPDTDSVTLWQVRRDLEGCIPNAPAQAKTPPPGEALIGLTLLELQRAGATREGPYWKMGARTVRVLRAANKLLHQVEAEFAWETPPAVAPDTIIAVGAASHSLPAHIARIETAPTIARGSKGVWYTQQDGLASLGIA